MSTVTLQWEHSSQWANPHPNDIYTLPVTFKDGACCEAEMEFFVSEMRLILKRVYHHFNGQEISYYNMGEFVETIDRNEAVENIKRYAQYVIDGYNQSGSLRHCPSFERVEDVDDNFNPL